MEEEFNRTVFRTLRASSIGHLFEITDNESHPFHMVVHTPVCRTGVRPVTFRCNGDKDATYFAGILDRLDNTGQTTGKKGQSWAQRQ